MDYKTIKADAETKIEAMEARLNAMVNSGISVEELNSLLNAVIAKPQN